MAEPYQNSYASYQAPPPGGAYYPPESHAQHQYQYQQPYGNGQYQPQDPNYAYAPQHSSYNLAPEQYQPGGPDTSYTPAGQPGYGGSLAPPAQGQKIPENMGY